ncbi:MAG: ParB/RepB/Spo0J family partition protein [Chloroflexi bacterium]|nr:ParB/RepB/Spo0J family partition protein [Chloroflexota bacterium]
MKTRRVQYLERIEPFGPFVSTIGVDLIEPSPRNPRNDLGAIDELAASIQAYGLLQPIVLREIGGRYEIVAGHRRFAAAKQLGWLEIGAVIRTDDQDSAYILTLVENLQREDLTPKEEARALEVLVRERGWTTREVAEAVKRSPAYISKRLRVFEDPALAPLVLGNQLSVSAAEELLPLGPLRRRALAMRAVAEGWEHAQVRQAVRALIPPRSDRQASLQHRVNQVRQLLGRKPADELTPGERRALRLLFMELALLAKASPGRHAPVGPALAVRRAPA